MVAILSSTEHPFYSFPLPLVVWSWKQIGVDCKVFIPEDFGPKLSLAMLNCESTCDFFCFQCEKEKEATYAQVSRLFGCAIKGMDSEETLITGDSDLAPFQSDYFKNLENGCWNIVGADLIEEEMQQFPMCFVSGIAADWDEIFNPEGKTYQELLDEHVGSIECENFKGNQWSLDQHLAHKFLSPEKIIHHPRAALPNRWATRRADRDGWHFNPNEIIDSHLPRPLTEQDNWDKVMKLFTDIYPAADISWMEAYRQEYLSL